MKGLLLKDLYMMRAYCKSYLLIIVVFLAASFFGVNTFFIYYPCLLGGMIPVTLLAYDEHSRFIQYSVSLPVSKMQIVSEKYILGLCAQISVLIVTAAAQAIRMSIAGTFEPDGFAIVVLSLFSVSLLTSSIPLPFIFKSGVEKGRIAYYVTIGLVCGAGVLFSQTFGNGHQNNIPSALIVGGLTILGTAAYVLSWYLSVVFYKKREL